MQNVPNNQYTMYQDPESKVITRHFVNLPGRQVHFRVAGSGPPLVLLHQSPTSSAEMATELEWLAPDFTVISPDSPGYGLSDPLDIDTPELSHYAEALAEFLDALGIERVLIYGFHTGAMIGLEFGRLFPERCALAVINGFVVLDDEERDELLANYLYVPEPDSHATQLAWLWRRMLDQTIFFPWYKKERSARMTLNAPPGAAIHRNLLDFLRAEKGGTIAYRAAFAYPTRELAPQITAPMYFLNYARDPLSTHPERLDAIPASVTREVPLAEPADVLERAREVLLEQDLAAVDLPRRSVGTADARLQKDIVNTSQGAVSVLRSAPGTSEAVLMLHDAGSSMQSLKGLADELAAERPVVLLDLPGHGDTDRLHIPDLTPATLIQLLDEVVAQLGLARIELVGFGASTVLAAAWSVSRSDLIKSLLLVDPWLFSEEEKRELRARYTPDPTPGECGEYLLRAWGFVRDSELFWPWYAPTADNSLGRDPDIDPAVLQARTVDVLKAGERFGALVAELLAYNLTDTLTRLQVPTTVGDRAGSRFDGRARQAAALNSAITHRELAADRSGWGTVIADLLTPNA